MAVPCAASRRRIAVSLAAALVVGLSPSTASADWTFGIFAGACATQDSSLSIQQPSNGTNVTLDGVRYDSASFAWPVYYGYRVGAFPRNGRFGLEGELIHMKVIADTARVVTVDGTVRGENAAGARPLSSLVERFSITHGVNLLLVNAVLRLAPANAREARWTFVGRAGAGASVPHAESTIGGVSVDHYEWGAFSAQGSAAAELRVSGPFRLSAEYKLTRTVQDVSIAGGSARTPLVTHHAAFGLTVRP